MITLIIGALGTISLVSMFFFNERKKILVMQVIGSVFFCIHYIMMGASTGAALNGIAAVRAVVFYHRDKKFFDHKAWLFLFVAICVAAGWLTWSGYISLLPTVGMIIATFGMYMKRPRNIRILSFISSPPWLVYNIINQSFPAMITDISLMVSILVGIIRYDILPRKKNSNISRTKTNNSTPQE